MLGVCLSRENMAYLYHLVILNRLQFMRHEKPASGTPMTVYRTYIYVYYALGLCAGMWQHAARNAKGSKNLASVLVCLCACVCCAADMALNGLVLPSLEHLMYTWKRTHVPLTNGNVHITLGASFVPPFRHYCARTQ